MRAFLHTSGLQTYGIIKKGRVFMIKNAVSPLICPHCKTSADGNVISLFWEYRERSWRCIICGYRGYEYSAQSGAKGAAKH